MPNYAYDRGTAFERKVAEFLAAPGRDMAVMRAAGSKGAGKMDLVAFAPDGRVLIVQCKITGIIAPAEWNRLWEISGWSRPAPYNVCAGVVPLVAMRREERAQPGQGWAPRFMRIDGPKVPRSRQRPWYVYDVAHGRDVLDADQPERVSTGG